MKKYLLPIISLLLFSQPIDAKYSKNVIVNKIGIKFVSIKPGTFLMGSPEEELGRERDETLHKVRITKGFYLSQTEITQKQWEKLMQYNPSDFKNCKDCPVERVSWEACQVFIKTLNKIENTKKYRLPTEAEWEYACRAGSKTAFANGKIKQVNCGLEPDLDKIGWYCGNSGVKQPIGYNTQSKEINKIVYNIRPHRVAQKRPNAWGLYDMHGNVHEWVQDSCEWRDPVTGSTGVITDTYKNNIKDPVCKKGTRKIFRGGSWSQGAKHSRSANRAYYRPKARRSNLGFRIVRDY